MCDDEPVTQARKLVLQAMGYSVVLSARPVVDGHYAVKFPDTRPPHRAYLGKFSFPTFPSEDEAWSAACADHQARVRRSH